MDIRKAYYMTTNHIDGNYNRLSSKVYDKTQSMGEFLKNIMLQRIISNAENSVKGMDLLDVFIITLKMNVDVSNFLKFLSDNSKGEYEQIDNFLYPLKPNLSLYEKYNKKYNKENFETKDIIFFRELFKNKEIDTVLGSYVRYLKHTKLKSAELVDYMIEAIKNADLDNLYTALKTTIGKKGVDYVQNLYKEVYFSLEEQDFEGYLLLENKYIEELEKVKEEKRNSPEEVEKRKMDKLIELYKFKEKTQGIFDNIVGQREQLKQIMQVLYNAQLGLNNPLGPKASILLSGPTGVGKTETAYAIANNLFENDPFVIDLSVYRGSHQLSTLIGSPPGYVGYDDKPLMLEFIKKHPEGGVLLFDEFDKANKDVLNIFMHMLDKGEVQSAKGESYDVRNFIIITTSNITEKVNNHIGFGAEKEDIKNVISGNEFGNVPPELIARFDLVLAYQSLTKEDKIELARRKMEIVCSKIKKLKEFLNVDIKYDEAVLEELANSVNDTMGIRELFRNVNNLATQKLVEYIMSNKYFTDFTINIKSLNEVEVKSLPKTQKRKEFSQELDKRLMEVKQNEKRKKTALVKIDNIKE